MGELAAHPLVRLSSTHMLGGLSHLGDLLGLEQQQLALLAGCLVGLLQALDLSLTHTHAQRVVQLTPFKTWICSTFLGIHASA